MSAKNELIKTLSDFLFTQTYIIYVSDFSAIQLSYFNFLRLSVTYCNLIIDRSIHREVQERSCTAISANGNCGNFIKAIENCLMQY